MRKPFVAGNWKMNLTKAEAVALAKGVAEKTKDVSAVDVAVIPAFVHLDAVAQALQGTNVALGAQDVYFEKNGAFTGEVSTHMLKDLGVEYVLIGHSERRHIIGETDALLDKKLHAALTAHLSVILCVGETLMERQTNKTFHVVRQQLTSGLLGGKSNAGPENLVIAYEPVWAIGTGQTATPAQAQEVHAFIRDELKEIFNVEIASSMIVQYGGSVKASNAAELIGEPDIDGALVGGASLKVDDFMGIIHGGAKVAGK